MKNRKAVTASLLTAAMCMGLAGVASAETNLPDPDGKPADMSKPVQVFVIMGQSNTLEMGKVTPDLGEKYPFLVDEAGKWTVRQDVRNVSLMQKGESMNVYRNDWLTVGGNKLGIEQGIGHQLGNAIDAPVMVLKSSIGNRSLGWDLLPPGSERYEFELTDNKTKETKTYIIAGYKDSPDKWEKGTEKPEGIAWYAGKQYDDDVGNAKKALAELDKYYPGAKGYEVAGFLWWQGDKDRYNPAHYTRYEKNLVTLVKALRKDFNAPKAAFVCASLGQTDESNTDSPDGKILEAMKNLASGKYKDELGDNIGFVYTHPLSKGSSSNAHYGGNAETYMNVGLGMGEAMTKLLK